MEPKADWQLKTYEEGHVTSVSWSVDISILESVHFVVNIKHRILTVCTYLLYVLLYEKLYASKLDD